MKVFNKIDLMPTGGRKAKLKGLAREVDYIVKDDTGDSRRVTVVASDETVDRDGDIIRTKGWENLDGWAKHGAVLWAHNHSLQGVAVPHKAWVEDKRLMAEFDFPVEYGRAHPASEAVYQGIKHKAIPAVSVGFMPTDTLDVSEEERADLGLGQYGVVFTAQELYEISPCNVGSNRSALIEQVKAAGIDTHSLEELLQHADNFVIEVKGDDDVAINDSGNDASDGLPDPPVTFTIDEMIARLEEDGYEVNKPEPEIEVVLELPEPAPPQIDGATVEAVVDIVRTAQLERTAKEAIRRAFSHQLGTVNLEE